MAQIVLLSYYSLLLPLRVSGQRYPSRIGKAFIGTRLDGSSRMPDEVAVIRLQNRAIESSGILHALLRALEQLTLIYWNGRHESMMISHCKVIVPCNDLQ